MPGCPTVLLFLAVASTLTHLSSGCKRRRSPPPPPPPPQPPRFENCPSDIIVTSEPGQLTASVNWTAPTAKSRNHGGIVAVKQTAGPESGSEFEDTFPVRIAYLAQESTRVPVSTCTFFVTVVVPRCPQLPSLQFGTRTCLGAGWNSHGSTCTHTCKDGYALEGSATLTCMTTRNWDAAPPTCSAKSCGFPPAMENGYPLCFNGHKYPNMCFVSCNAGYKTQGTPLLFCRVDGSWSTLPSCVDASPPQFPNGCLHNMQLYSGPLEAAIAVHFQYPEATDNSGVLPTLTSYPARGAQLGPGYHVFRITATDGSSNRASCNFVVNIKGRNCPTLWAPANGHLTCTRGYVEGSECSLTCNHGYQVQGQAMITCLSSETWNAVAPTCIVLECPSPPKVDHGFYQCPGGSTAYRSSCSLVCDEGFQVTSSSSGSIQCSIDRTWTSPGECEDKQAPVFPSGCPDNIDHSAARLGQPTKVTWDIPDVTDNSGQEVTLKSDITPGSTLNLGTTTVTYTATDTSGNQATCDFKITVTTDVCELPALDPNMVYDCPDGYVYGAACSLNCTRGYPLDGPSTIKCERDDGTSPPRVFWDWVGPSSVQPKCTASTCPDLDPPTNGALSCMLTSFGYDCLMNCQENFDIPAAMVNEGHLYCTNSAGVWVPSSAPDCLVPLRPTSVALHSDLFYFTGNCSSSLDDIKKNFITRMNTHPVLADACVNVPSCTVDKVQVTCGPVSSPSRRKRRSADSHYINIKFEITPQLPFANYSTEQLKEKIEGLKTSVNSVLNPLIANGTFDISGASDLSLGAIYTTTACPNGTKAFTSRPFNCVGCSQGYFMNQSGQCEECPVGHYTGLQEATTCSACPAGWSTPGTGSTSSSQCKEVCSPGTFSPSGFAPCQPCPVGRYASRAGARTCDVCPLNTWTVNVSSSSPQQCIRADIKPGKQPLQGQIHGNGTSLTFSMWVRLPNNSNVQTTIVNNGSDDKVAVFSFTSGAPSSTSPAVGVPFANIEVSSDAWFRNIIVLRASDVDVSQLPPKVHSLDIGSGSFNNPILQVLTTSKQVLLSDLRVTGGIPTVNDVNADLTSCTRDNSNNLLSLTLSPSIMSLPSICDVTNDCASSPCKNDGACVDEMGGFECRCVGGYSGPTCLQPPDSCYLHQCQNGATCLPEQGNYTCTCSTGFTGDLCQTEIVDGGWGEWKSLSECSATCGGQQQRQRLCNNPAPQNGGQNCTGETTQTQNCGPIKCPVNGTWEDWSPWEPCSATCAGGRSNRKRECSTEEELSDDEVASCVGESSETKVCNTTTLPCPVHGSWSAWESWASCSASCGDGLQSRGRSCDTPVPEYGGDDCEGNSTENQPCVLKECPRCSQLPRPTGGFPWKCATSESPYLETCNITCLSGYTAVGTPSFICGPGTGYKWPHEREQGSGAKIPLPTCQKKHSIQSAIYTTSVELSDSGGSACDTSHTGPLRDNAEQQLESQVACLQAQVCQMSASAQCQQDGSQRKKRSTPSMLLIVNYTVNLGPPRPLDTSADFNDYDNKSQIAEDSMLKDYDINSLFRVTIGGLTYTPDPDSVQTELKVLCPAGQIYLNRFCVSCPLGSMEQSGECVLCPLGQYQDESGATTCKPCPPGMAWDLPGASDRSLCLYSIQEEPSSPPTKQGKGNNTNRILSIVLPLMGLLCVVAVCFAVYYKCKFVKGNRRRRSSVASWMTIHRVAPSPTTPPSYLDHSAYFPRPPSGPPPAYELRRPGSALSFFGEDNLEDLPPKS